MAPSSISSRFNTSNSSSPTNRNGMLIATVPTTKESTAVTKDENKYGKRRHQKHQQRMRQTMILFLVAFGLLGYTMYHVKYNPKPNAAVLLKQQANGGDDEAADGDDDRHTALRRQQNHKMKRRQHRPKEQPKRKRRTPPKLKHQEFPQVDDGDGDDEKTDDGEEENENKIPWKVTREKLKVAERALETLEDRIMTNRNAGIRWVNPGLTPPIFEGQEKPMLEVTDRDDRTRHLQEKFFKVKRESQGIMAWEVEAKAKQHSETRYNFVDYTKHKYVYPQKLMEPPAKLGDYPKLTPLKELMEQWPQDNFDNPPNPIEETLIHFDYTNPKELEAAGKFRDAKLPFKLINVPEVVAAGHKWTDEYLTKNFDGGYDVDGPLAEGTCQESPDNFFAFFIPPQWNVEIMGLPPTRNNDWTFEKWTKHAKYADHVGLDPNQPHYYYQAGVDRTERYKDKEEWTFISKDLPSFSSPTETFFVFEPKFQKGIQCRFGERGVTAATHFDSGRNMIAMMTGAKRYVLSPPRECSKLGIINEPGNAIYRHSMLNFGHLNHMDGKDMPQEEREWLERAGSAGAISTILKAGEVLYIPSFWFHYITSLQKSAQCNVRSGIDEEGDEVFGNYDDVSDKCNA